MRGAWFSSAEERITLLQSDSYEIAAELVVMRSQFIEYNARLDFIAPRVNIESSAVIVVNKDAWNVMHFPDRFVPATVSYLNLGPFLFRKGSHDITIKSKYFYKGQWMAYRQDVEVHIPSTSQYIMVASDTFYVGPGRELDDLFTRVLWYCPSDMYSDGVRVTLVDIGSESPLYTGVLYDSLYDNYGAFVFVSHWAGLDAPVSSGSFLIPDSDGIAKAQAPSL